MKHNTTAAAIAVIAVAMLLAPAMSLFCEADAEDATVATVTGPDANGSYTTLQAAFDEINKTDVSGDYTVNITANIDEEGGAKITQKAGKNLTINGNDYTMTVNLHIDGEGRYSAEETLTITGLNFDVASGDAISSSRDDRGSGRSYNYAHNITITDCDFKLTGTNTVGVRLWQSHHAVISDCTFSGGHSMLQAIAANDVKITDIQIDCTSGIALGTSTDVVISNVVIVAEECGIRGDCSTSNSTVTITNCTITAEQPIVIRYATDANTGNYSISVSDTALVLTEGSEFDAITVTAGSSGEAVVTPTKTDAVAVTTSNITDEIVSDDTSADDTTQFIPVEDPRTQIVPATTTTESDDDSKTVVACAAAAVAAAMMAAILLIDVRKR